MAERDERRYRKALREIARMPDAIPQWDLARQVADRVADEGLTFKQAVAAVEHDEAEMERTAPSLFGPRAERGRS